MEMASIIALPICEVRRDLRNLGNQRRRLKGARRAESRIASWQSPARTAEAGDAMDGQKPLRKISRRGKVE
jgi:hypothetical protein